MLRRHKTRLYDALLRLWIRIDDSQLIDFPRVTAHATIRLKTAVFGAKSLSIRALITASLTSITLTTIALSFLAFRSGSPSFRSFATFFPGLFYRYQMFIPAVYLTNLAYDLATLWTTIFVLGIVISRGTSIRGFLFLLTDAVIAFLLAVACLYSAVLISEQFNHLWILDRMKDDVLAQTATSLHDLRSTGSVVAVVVHVGESLWSTLRAVITLGVEGNTYNPMALGSATTLAPTIVYVGILMFLMIAKTILTLSAYSTQYALEKATEPNIETPDHTDKFKPFTILGMVASVFSGLVAFTVLGLSPK